MLKASLLQSVHKTEEDTLGTLPLLISLTKVLILDLLRVPTELCKFVKVSVAQSVLLLLVLAKSKR